MAEMDRINFLKQKFTEQIQAKNTPELSWVLALQAWLGLITI